MKSRRSRRRSRSSNLSGLLASVHELMAGPQVSMNMQNQEMFEGLAALLNLAGLLGR